MDCSHELYTSFLIKGEWFWIVERKETLWNLHKYRTMAVDGPTPQSLRESIE